MAKEDELIGPKFKSFPVSKDRSMRRELTLWLSRKEARRLLETAIRAGLFTEPRLKRRRGTK